MKNASLLVITCFFVANCFGQDTVERRNRLTDSVIERFYVLKSNPEIRQGPYRALFKRKIIVAAGYYTNGKRTGKWFFFNQAGILVERYNYDTHSFLYEGPLDTTSDLSFRFDEKIKKTDTVTRPLKVGGTYYGFIPYLNIFQLPFDAIDINTDYIDVTVELLISPGGRLADYKVHLYSALYQYKQTFNMALDLFSEEDKVFYPALLNGKPVLSRILIRCFINRYGGLDFY